MTGEIDLFHATDEENYDDILQEGLIPPARRDDAGDLVAHQVAKNSIYMFDPDEAENWIIDGVDGNGYMNRPRVKCRVPKDEVYVVEWGNKTVEKAPIEELEELRPTYEEWENETYDCLEDENLMFLYPGEISPENLSEAGAEKEVYASSVSF